MLMLTKVIKDKFELLGLQVGAVSPLVTGPAQGVETNPRSLILHNYVNL